MSPPNKDSERVLELADLTEALAPLDGQKMIPPAPRLAEALENALVGDLDLDLRIADDDALASDDPVRRTRLIYVMSLLRIWDYLRQPTRELKDKRESALFALGYAKHAESTNLEALKFGRSASDDTLKKQVGELRERVKSLAAQKRENNGEP